MDPVFTSLPRQINLLSSSAKVLENLLSPPCNQKCLVHAWLLKCKWKSARNCTISTSHPLSSSEILRLFSKWLPGMIPPIFPSSRVPELMKSWHWQRLWTGSGVLDLLTLRICASDQAPHWNRSILISGYKVSISSNPKLCGQSENVRPSSHLHCSWQPLTGLLPSPLTPCQLVNWPFVSHIEPLQSDCSCIPHPEEKQGLQAEPFPDLYHHQILHLLILYLLH